MKVTEQAQAAADVQEATEVASASRENVFDLRLAALHRLFVAGATGGVLWYAYLGLILELTDLRLWSSSLTLIGVSALAYWVTRQCGFTVGVLLFAGGALVAILLAVWAMAQPALLLFLVLPVGIISLLIGGQAGFLAGGLVIAGLAGWTWLGALSPFTLSMVQLSAIFIIIMVVFLWIATYPLQTTMQWAWSGYERARRQTERVRDHRARLMRTVKELDNAYERLKIMAVELDRARLAANEARRLKAEFAANISHELRTPLNLIIGFSEMMALAPQTYGTLLPPAYRGDIQAIYRNAKHLSNLIDDVLDLSQIEAGRMGLYKEPVAPARIIDEAMETVATLFTARNLYLTTELEAELPLLEVDRTRVRQVLINLLNNAARFTREGGVRIIGRADAKDVTITVSDTGPGIAPADLPRIFQEFRQLNGSAQGGSGLGLAISKKFIELHGGRMWATSQLGQGTDFHFSLPRQASLGINYHTVVGETWVRLLPEQPDQKNIVVVGEEPETVHFFERYLEGYRVLPAANLDEVRALAGRESIHAIVVVAPSGETGWIRLRRMREGLPNVPALVCTLRGGAGAARPAGVTTYLVKPVSQARFLETLAALGHEVEQLLLVDDSPEVVRLLGRMVRNAPRPYRALKAYNGRQALDLLRQRRPDAVVLDLLMPEVDGYTVIEYMRAHEAFRDIPVIVISARGLEEEVITAGLVGVTRREGFSVGEMMRCLQASLDALRPPALVYTDPERPGASPG